MAKIIISKTRCPLLNRKLETTSNHDQDHLPYHIYYLCIEGGGSVSLSTRVLMTDNVSSTSLSMSAREVGKV